MITNFKDKNNKSKKKFKNYKTLTTKMKSFHPVFSFETTSSSSTLSLTGVGLIVIPISTATACGLSIGNKVKYEIIINIHSIYKKQYEKDQQSIKSFDKLHGRSLQDSLVDKIEYETLCDIFTKHLEETKNESF